MGKHKLCHTWCLFKHQTKSCIYKPLPAFSSGTHKEKNMSLRFKPLSLNQDLTLKNRLVLPPMASGTCDSEGLVTQKTIEHYENLAQSGAGLMFVEYSFVNYHGRTEPNQMGAHSDLCIPGLSEVAKTLKKSGAVVGLQITHGGGKGSTKLPNGRLEGPSAVSVPSYNRVLETMEQMTAPEIEAMIQDFANAAQRAQKAGFDLVELHCAHGYGLNQWLSPVTNKRYDEYGGNLEKNSRVLFNVIEAIKERCPGFPIAIRMPAQDYLEGGLTSDDMQLIAQRLEKAGLCLVDISSGLGGWNLFKEHRSEGYLVAGATEIKKAVSIPVIGVGGIKSVEYFEEALAEERADLLAVGRGILEDAKGWKRKF